MLGEMAASLSHELKQPIAAALISASSALEWLNRDEPNLERARETTARIVKYGTRATDIIDGMRATISTRSSDDALLQSGGSRRSKTVARVEGATSLSPSEAGKQKRQAHSRRYRSRCSAPAKLFEALRRCLLQHSAYNRGRQRSPARRGGTWQSAKFAEMTTTKALSLSRLDIATYSIASSARFRRSRRSASIASAKWLDMAWRLRASSFVVLTVRAKQRPRMLRTGLRSACEQSRRWIQPSLWRRLIGPRR